MGFLSRLFGGHGGRDRWYVKVDLITELSEIARKYWREEWTAIAAPERTGAGADVPPVAPEVERAFTRYQAALVADFIAEQQYLSADERADFHAFLLRSMLGEDDSGAALDPDGFAVAVAHAVGVSHGALDTIRETLPGFALEQQYIAALAFGDGETARRLKAQIEGTESDAGETDAAMGRV
jgi:hypothetical protein